MVHDYCENVIASANWAGVGFIQKTMTPEIFWGALSSLATLLAVIVAVLYPIISHIVRLKRIKRLVLVELEMNRKIFDKLHKSGLVLKDGPLAGQVVDSSDMNTALIDHISVRIWNQFKFDLAESDPRAFSKIDNVYKQIEIILDEKRPHNLLRQLAFKRGEVDSVDQAYNALKEK